MKFSEALKLFGSIHDGMIPGFYQIQTIRMQRNGKHSELQYYRTY